MTITQAEYIWLDGEKPTQTLRSKTRVIELPENPTVKDFPNWGFDGSSTQQAEGNESDCALHPVSFVTDPVRGYGNYLVLCEVFLPTGEPHPTNTRAILRAILDAGAAKTEPMFGFEQEYTLFDGRDPLGFPNEGYPRPQGPFYCGVGSNRAFGRDLVEAHTQACIDANLQIFGTNAEVMPGQWEFQIGPRDVDSDNLDPLVTADHVWFATWLLHRIAEDFDIVVSFENKPIKGDWNGAGCHTNFSTKAMRDPSTGKEAIDDALKALEKNHRLHVAVYGSRLHERLTGAHETCAITEFKAGVSDRGASVRIPMNTDDKGYGYLEDRRPGANSDPYLVEGRLLTTICHLDESLFPFGKKELTQEVDPILVG